MAQYFCLIVKGHMNTQRMYDIELLELTDHRLPPIAKRYPLSHEIGKVIIWRGDVINSKGVEWVLKVLVRKSATVH